MYINSPTAQRHPQHWRCWQSWFRGRVVGAGLCCDSASKLQNSRWTMMDSVGTRLRHRCKCWVVRVAFHWSKQGRENPCVRNAENLGTPSRVHHCPRQCLSKTKFDKYQCNSCEFQGALSFFVVFWAGSKTWEAVLGYMQPHIFSCIWRLEGILRHVP